MAVQKKEVTSGEMLTDKVELIWRIENYSMIWKSRTFRSQQKLEFQVGANIGLESDWKVYFVEKIETSQTPEGTVTRKKNRQLWVWLKKAPEGVQELMSSLRLRIKAETDADNREFSKDFFNLVNNNASEKNYGWLVFNDAVDLPLINDCLVMELEVTVMQMKGPDPLSLRQQSQMQIEALFKPKFTEKMQQEFAKLLEGSNKQSDATIVSKDEVEFPVHRYILSERSPVFERIFKTPMTEAKSGIVVIPDLSSKTVAVLLRYIYTGTLHQDWSDVQVLPELVYAGNKYGLQDLVDFLDQVVGHVCSKENAGRLFSLLGKLGMQTGEREVHNFITKHTLSFEDMASFVEEGTQPPEQLDAQTKKWNVLRMLRNSWRMAIERLSRNSLSQKTKDKVLSSANDPIPS